MLRPFAFITRQGSHVKGDILPGVGSVASGHSLTFPKKRAPKMKVRQTNAQQVTGLKMVTLRIIKVDVGGTVSEFFAHGRRSVVKIYTGKCLDVPPPKPLIEYR